MAFLDTLNKLLGDPNEKELKRLRPMIATVRQAEKDPAIRALTLADLPKKTAELKSRIQSEIAAGKDVQKVLNDILPEAFAVAIRACELLKESGAKIQMGKQEFGWDMIPFDVQILGGVALHRGNIAEMRTGEGKTLVCTLPVYLNALLGKGVHVVTVNDYLARRDATWMSLLYKALGLTVGVVVHGLPTAQRREAYASDVTYGTNSEFGFDYLRDNMAPSRERQVQRGLHYAIVDEVDSILIDEARTPLIISQPADESTTKYAQYAQLVGQLKEGEHYTKDEKQRTAVLTEEGIKKMEQLLGIENIYTDRGFQEVHHIEQALKAHAIFARDVDYVVNPANEVVIVDEFTGRLMPGRRYSHGLHQAIEAKERVPVQRESKTLATITFQNYFRLFKKLAGMTGTAKTEEEEFESIYKLRVLTIPTHRQMVRNDRADAVYRTVAAKFTAVAKIAKEKYEKGQPILIGTTSVEKSEAMSALLEREGVPHQVLNAKQHEKEAEIVANAGQEKSVTIATNMAGRGTDIKLGAGVAALGGLAILGTERHEARRIDNQLRGRAGRQGDPGESLFFVSMEDDLMRLFGGDRLKSMMERLRVPDDVPLENGMVSRSIESAQKKVEGRNFDIRRHVLQYDDVMNRHRNIIYIRRQKILERIAEGEKATEVTDATDVTDTSVTSATSVALPLHEEILAAMRRDSHSLVDVHARTDDPEEWEVQKITAGLGALHQEFAQEFSIEKLKKYTDREILKDDVTVFIHRFYKEKCESFDVTLVGRAESIITLRSIDAHWMDHIDDMSHLREQVAFSGYAQRDPLIEYQDQGFRRFQQLLQTIDSTIVRTLLQSDFAMFAPQSMVVFDEEEREADLQTNEADIEVSLTGGGGGTTLQLSPEEAKDIPFNMTAQQPQKRSATPPTSAKATAGKQQRSTQEIGRNDPCPCGSGKKYKKCHGKNA
ncbi:MAG: preprotein translocase subunit SecA [Candidatus Peribacteraceae bacterium]|nr:preprotein translocase subunit SecA [Candidatus Peribacteraceae bacterium]